MADEEPTGEGAPAAEGVHRLVDMVVEEVSLVDRAANQRRFLVVKRRSAMANEGESEQGSGSAPGEAAAATIEALTALTELVSAAAAKAFPPPRKPGSTGASGESGAEGDGDDEEEDDDEDPEERRKAAESVQALITQVKGALGRLQAALAAPAAAKRAPNPDAVLAKLEAIATAVSGLDARLQAQDARLGKVEKNVGLPASRTPEGRGRDGDDTDEVSWPMDLNAPMDRASVDKSVSFHDEDR